MTRQTLPRTARSDAGHPMQSPYTAAIRAVAALAAEGAIPKAFPKLAPSQETQRSDSPMPLLWKPASTIISD